MTPESFVTNWVELKNELLESFAAEHGNTAVAKQIEEMNLSEIQRQQLRQVLDGVLRDTMYTLLLGLDGCTSIGRVQQVYTILDENGAIINSGGSLESEAWLQFQKVQ